MDLTIAPDAGDDAIPAAHVFQCATPLEDGKPCGWVTLPSLVFEDAREAAFDHLATHPDHDRYQHVASQPWRISVTSTAVRGPVAPLAHTTCTPPAEDVDGGWAARQPGSAPEQGEDLDPQRSRDPEQVV